MSVDNLSASELKLLAIEFNLFDVNGEGELNRENVSKLFKHLNPKIAGWEIDRLITIYDTNNDGSIQFDEFVEMNRLQKKDREVSDVKALSHHFEALDFNLNGTISTDEISNILLAAVDPTTEGLIVALKLAAQDSEDDEVDFIEFKNAIIQMNRRIEQEIAELKIREYIVKDRLKADIDTKLQSDLESLQANIQLKKKQMMTAEATTFTKVYQAMINRYHSQQSAFDNVQSFFDFIGVNSGETLLKSIDKSGEYPDVFPGILNHMPPGKENSKEFQQLCEFLYLNFIDEETAINAELRSNIVYHRCFLHYTLQRSAIAAEGMTRTNFLQFVKEFELLSISSPPLLEEDARVCAITAMKKCKQPVQGMDFDIWVDATLILFQKILGLSQVPTGTKADALFKKYIFTQNVILCNWMIYFFWIS